MALALGVVGLLGALVPYFGLLGILAVVVAATGTRATDGPTPRFRRGVSLAAAAFGSVATVLAALVLLLPVASLTRGSSPRVYSDDGAAYRLEGSLLAGALYPWAVRRDVARLAFLHPASGEVRLRVQNDHDGTDNLDAVNVWIVDHDAATEILPTPLGALLGVEDAKGPLRAVDGAGADVRAALMAEDGAMLTGATIATPSGDPRQTWTLEFPRPAGPLTRRAIVVLRARSTSFAEEALFRYLATMGQGMGPLMEWVETEECTTECPRTLLAEELERLAIPLLVKVLSGTRVASVHAVAPIGPAVVRSFALPIDVPPEGDVVSLRLEATPSFWDIDRVELAEERDPSMPIVPRSLRPRAATLISGPRSDDVLDRITEDDRRRVTLRRGEHVDLRFDAPPQEPGLRRSTFVALRGYYRVPIGGRRFVDPAAVLSHRWGLTSLPRFAGGL